MLTALRRHVSLTAPGWTPFLMKPEHVWSNAVGLTSPCRTEPNPRFGARPSRLSRGWGIAILLEGCIIGSGNGAGDTIAHCRGGDGDDSDRVHTQQSGSPRPVR